jgi:hypothetical protein
MVFAALTHNDLDLYLAETFMFPNFFPNPTDVHIIQVSKSCIPVSDCYLILFL